MYPDNTAVENYVVTVLLADSNTNNLDEQDEEYAPWRDFGKASLCEGLGMPSRPARSTDRGCRRPWAHGVLLAGQGEAPVTGSFE